MARLVFGAVAAPVQQSSGSSDTVRQLARQISGPAHPQPFSIEVEGDANTVVGAMNSASGGWTQLLLVDAQGHTSPVHINPQSVLFVRD